MIVLEYIKMSFVFAGGIVMIAFIARMWTAQNRKLRLYKHASYLLEEPEKEHKRNTSTEIILSSSLDQKKINEFLSMVSIEDISSDTFLKAIVDKVLIPDKIDKPDKASDEEGSLVTVE